MVSESSPCCYLSSGRGSRGLLQCCYLLSGRRSRWPRSVVRDDLAALFPSDGRVSRWPYSVVIFHMAVVPDDHAVLLPLSGCSPRWPRSVVTFHQAVVLDDLAVLLRFNWLWFQMIQCCCLSSGLGSRWPRSVVTFHLSVVPDDLAELHDLLGHVLVRLLASGRRLGTWDGLFSLYGVLLTKGAISLYNYMLNTAYVNVSLTGLPKVQD